MSCKVFNRKITVEKVTETQSSSGHPSETWSAYVTRWAKVEPLRGRELFVAQQFEGEVDVRFQLRYDSKTAAIRPKMRIQYDNRTFDIKFAYNVEEDRKMIEIMATEVK